MPNSLRWRSKNKFGSSSGEAFLSASRLMRACFARALDSALRHFSHAAACASIWRFWLSGSPPVKYDGISDLMWSLIILPLGFLDGRLLRFLRHILPFSTSSLQQNRGG